MPSEVDQIHRLIRAELLATFGEQAGCRLPILYGGSVGTANVGSLMALDGIDGCLVGGASLTAASFLPIAGLVRESGPQGV